MYLIHKSDYLRIVLLYLFFILTGFALSAQTGPTEPAIRLLARPHGDSITLRWAPVDYVTWSAMRQRGVALERRVAGDSVWQSVTTERLIAFSLEEFKELTDTDDANIVAVAHALYGDVSPPATMPTGPMGMAKLKLDEQEQRYFLAALNADLSGPAARALGWGWTDRTVVRSLPYEYRVRLLPAPKQVGPTLTSETIRVRSTDNFPFGPVVGLTAEPGDGELTLTWPEFPNRKRYIGYYLEISEDGQNFTATTEVPIIKTRVQQEGNRGFTLTVEDLTNYVPRHYRLIGVNSFGEKSAPGEAIVTMSVDRTSPVPPSNLRAEDNKTGGFRLNWDFPETASPDSRGYVVVRSSRYEGPFQPVHDQMLDLDVAEFTDPNPIPYVANYYRVMTFDTAGNQAATVPAMALWEDGTPPATPVGITGQIDTLGNVFLMWEPGTEPDLKGYRVYVSHARDREFLQVTTEVLRKNFFFDSTSLEVLNETIYYKVVAVDNNYNASPYSEILTLKRPDKVPPAAPLLTDYVAAGETVTLRWQRSGSPDVDRQDIWRKSPTEDWRPLRALASYDSVFVDTSVVARTSYSYRVRSIDEAGLWGESPTLSLNSGVRTSFPNVSAWARSQVPGQDEEAVSWQAPPGVRPVAYQLYIERPGGALLPHRKLPATVREWTVPPALRDAAFAIKTLYPGGGQSALSTRVRAAK